MASSDDDEAARRERLRQLFGDDAAKSIAEQSRPEGKRSKRPSDDEVAAEIQMLIEGMQTLDWGQVRLIDVAMTDGPLEASFDPLLPDSSLLCVRIDMPLVRAALMRLHAGTPTSVHSRRRASMHAHVSTFAHVRLRCVRCMPIWHS